MSTDTPEAVKNPALLPLFARLRSLLEPYAEHLTVRRDDPGRYELWSDKRIVIASRQRTGVFFAGLIIQKSYVGLYYMPVYTHDEARGFFGPGLLAHLKGKSCFHLKRLTPELEREIEDALGRGFALYRSNGWIGAAP